MVGSGSVSRALTAIAVSALASVAATGCTHTAEEDQPDARPAGRAVREVTAPEAALLHRATQELIRECMVRRGFRYWVIAHKPVPEHREFPYVVDDVAWARTHGYGGDIENRLRRLSESHPNKRYFAGLSTDGRRAALTAINGERPVGLEAPLPDGGVVRRSDSSCTSQAEQQLYGDVRTWYRVQQIGISLKAVRQQRVGEDRRFTQAVARWARCMGATGHRYATPLEVRHALPPPGSRQAHATEVRLAVAEATCAHSTGLAAVARELDVQHRAALENEHRADITTRRRLELAALPHARAILART